MIKIVGNRYKNVRNIAHTYTKRIKHLKLYPKCEFYYPIAIPLNC